MLAVVMACTATAAYAQWGTIGNIKNTVKSVKDAAKQVNGDVEFTQNGQEQGFYRARTNQIFLNKKHDVGKRKGKSISFKLEDDGRIVNDIGDELGMVKDNGVVSCHNVDTYLTLMADGSIVMDGDVVGKIDSNSRVYMFGEQVGTAPQMPRQLAAYLFFGYYQDKNTIQEKKQVIQAEQARRAEEAAKLKAQQEARAKQQAKTQGTTTKTTTKSTSKEKPKAREYRIEKGSARGYVDENGVVYDWAHTKIGQLPKGSGDIYDGRGTRIGNIWSGDIKDSSGNLLCSVTSGGSIAVKGSNATVAEVHAAGRVDMSKDSRTLGYCDCNNYVWTAAIIFCDLFKF